MCPLVRGGYAAVGKNCPLLTQLQQGAFQCPEVSVLEGTFCNPLCSSDGGQSHRGCSNHSNFPFHCALFKQRSNSWIYLSFFPARRFCQDKLNNSSESRSYSTAVILCTEGSQCSILTTISCGSIITYARGWVLQSKHCTCTAASHQS